MEFCQLRYILIPDQMTFSGRSSNDHTMLQAKSFKLELLTTRSLIVFAKHQPPRDRLGLRSLTCFVHCQTLRGTVVHYQQSKSLLSLPSKLLFLVEYWICQPSTIALCWVLCFIVGYKRPSMSHISFEDMRRSVRSSNWYVRKSLLWTRLLAHPQPSRTEQPITRPSWPSWLPTPKQKKNLSAKESECPFLSLALSVAQI